MSNTNTVAKFVINLKLFLAQDFYYHLVLASLIIEKTFNIFFQYVKGFMSFYGQGCYPLSVFSFLFRVAPGL